MTLEEKIKDCIQDLCIAYETESLEYAEYINKRLAYLIAQRTPEQVRKMEIEKGLV